MNHTTAQLHQLRADQLQWTSTLPPISAQRVNASLQNLDAAIQAAEADLDWETPFGEWVYDFEVWVAYYKAARNQPAADKAATLLCQGNLILKGE